MKKLLFCFSLLVIARSANGMDRGFGPAGPPGLARWELPAKASAKMSETSETSIILRAEEKKGEGRKPMTVEESFKFISDGLSAVMRETGLEKLHNEEHEAGVELRKAIEEKRGSEAIRLADEKWCAAIWRRVRARPAMQRKIDERSAAIVRRLRAEGLMPMEEVEATGEMKSMSGAEDTKRKGLSMKKLSLPATF